MSRKSFESFPFGAKASVLKFLQQAVEPKTEDSGDKSIVSNSSSQEKPWGGERTGATRKVRGIRNE